MKNTVKYAVLGACALAASSTAVLAGSELFPGITTGLPVGTPLPPGVYSVTIGAYGEYSGKYGNEQVGALAPSWLIWWTPWSIAGARIGFTTVTAFEDANVISPLLTAHINGANNTLVTANIGWNFPSGFNVAFYVGAYLPDTTPLLGRDLTSFLGVGAFTYSQGGWNVYGTFSYGTGGTDNTNISLVTGKHLVYADWFNGDMTLSKTMGKWELGVVAYGSTDLQNEAFAVNLCAPVGHATPKTCEQSQFAVGGLVGYNFGPADVQFKLTRDVTEQNYVGPATIAWMNIIIPLWNPAAESLK